MLHHVTNLQEIFPGQSEWEHNFCRNPEGDMEFPICFIEGGDYDICVVPDCDELEVRRREVQQGIPEMCRRHRAATQEGYVERAKLPDGKI